MTIQIASDINWSPEQLSIFSWFDTGLGNLVVRARAGTGKTTTIVKGIDFAKEDRILLAAFNKSIADELQRKLKNPKAEAKTLHALGLSFLTRAWRKIRIDGKGERAKGLAQKVCPNSAPDVIVSIVSKLHTKCREINPFCDKIDDVYKIALEFDLLPSEEWIKLGWTDERVSLLALKAMEKAKDRTDIIDFSDMLFLPLVHNFIMPIYDLVVIDEAQDMSHSQLLLAARACKGRTCVVGDNRQAIYKFRGADSNSLDRLKGELKAKELGLTITYRCPRKIVALAQEIVPDYQAAPSAPEGTIETITKEKMIELAKEGDFILSRKNAPLASICMALLKLGKRARIKGKDIGAGLISKLKSFELRSLDGLAKALNNWVSKERARLEGIDEEIIAARMEFINDQSELLMVLAEGLSSVIELEARIKNLFVDNAEQQAIMCSSVHKAKGLETKRVFLLQGTFRANNIEEDNIKYVGITRSQDTLYWVLGYEK